MKKAVAKLVVTENLSFNLVEADSFVELLKLCNPSIEKLLFKSDTITEHVVRTFWVTRGKICEIFGNQQSKISITCDLWTSPNSKAILAITSHWTDEYFNLKEILLDVIEMREAHTGEKIAEQVVKTLEEFGLREKLFCITADNASSNRTMARAISNAIKSFSDSQHLLGCTGHVFNLAAQAGLKAIDYIPEILVTCDDRLDYQ